MIHLVCLVAAALILIAMLLGMWRIGRNASAVDRILALQLAGSMGLAATLLTGRALDVAGVVDVALVGALLAAVTTVSFVMSGYKFYASEDDEL